MAVDINTLLQGPQGQEAGAGDDPALHTSLDWLKTWSADIKRARAFTQYQYVDVVFNATANADTDIVHTLKPPTVDSLDWEVVGVNFAAAPAAAPVIYRDTSATRRPWGNGYLVLRSNVASLSVTLRLTVRAPV